ncbi:MAG: UTP--glucose-1-phosphate uridylyltransferase [Gammaproteobacteria bacterium]|nr:MAG: UTP--glucose-1-phosphate uridylyltransferase [Gammaproteobacteria bacterium]
MTWRVRKAVFPVAGLGTRFLPATKASPKEMLPVVDKPLIQYAVEEAVAAGIEVLIFVTGRNKRAIEDHFDKAYELEDALAAKQKAQLLEEVRSILPRGVSFVYTRQPEPLGLGHAVLCAEPVVEEEPFAVILADDLIDAQPGCLSQMVSLYGKHRCSLLGVEEVPPGQLDQYGVVAVEAFEQHLHRVRGIVEKPGPGKAPSSLGVVGRYLLEPRIFHHLRRLGRGSGGEIQLTDAIAALLKEAPVLAYRFSGVRYDCGSKLGYMKACVEYGLRHPQLGDALRRYLEERLASLESSGVAPA